MIRKFVVLLLFTLLCFGGCKKSRALAEKTVTGSAAPSKVTEGASSAAIPEPPSQPDLTPAASTPPARPPVDTSASVMVLCYHNIDEKGAKSLTITVPEFEKNMQEVKDAGYSVIGMQDFLAWRRGEKSIPKKSCVITIDDGWVSGYTNAWPVLKKFGYPFTMFIYVNYVGTGGKSLSWAQLEEMRDAGVDIESHTYSHSDLRVPGKGMDKHNSELVRKDLAELGPDGWLRKEIIESKKTLEKQLGIKVNAIAYPFGIYTSRVRELVKEAGYEAGFTVYGQRLSHSSPFDLLGRYAVDSSQPKIFKDALAMIGGGVGGSADAPAPAMAQLAVASMITQPMNNETVNTGTPLIKANLSTMGEIEPGSLEVRLSGIGPVPADFNKETKVFTAQVKQPLKPGAYSVIVSAKIAGQRAETRWNFNVGAGAIGAARPDPVPVAVATTPAPAKDTPAIPVKGKAKPKH